MTPAIRAAHRARRTLRKRDRAWRKRLHQWAAELARGHQCAVTFGLRLPASRVVAVATDPF